MFWAIDKLLLFIEASIVFYVYSLIVYVDMNAGDDPSSPGHTSFWSSGTDWLRMREM